MYLRLLSTFATFNFNLRRCIMAGHDVPPDVLTSILYWLRKGCASDGVRSDCGSVSEELERCRKTTLEGSNYCCNDGCEVVGVLKDFKVCPQCKTARYCGAVCQKKD
jgi:hypothetical protein